MAKSRSGLGRDFYSLLDDNILGGDKSNAATMIRIADIEPRSDQPRKTFTHESLEQLADSIGQFGVLQPIIVRESNLLQGTYEIIAGERRWRASKMAGLNEIPAVVLDGDDLKAAQVAVIENVQREDLNPVEEAMAYDALIERFDLTQEAIAKQVGKSRSAIANTLRLLELPETISEMVKDESISAGHARALLPLGNAEDMELAANRIIARELSVRETESLVKSLLSKKSREEELDIDGESATEHLTRLHMKDLERRSREALGRRVRITNTGKKKTVELSFENNEDLEAILKLLCGDDFFASDNF